MFAPSCNTVSCARGRRAPAYLQSLRVAVAVRYRTVVAPCPRAAHVMRACTSLSSHVCRCLPHHVMYCSNTCARGCSHACASAEPRCDRRVAMRCGRPSSLRGTLLCAHAFSCPRTTGCYARMQICLPRFALPPRGLGLTDAARYERAAPPAPLNADERGWWWCLGMRAACCGPGALCPVCRREVAFFWYKDRLPRVHCALALSVPLSAIFRARARCVVGGL